ncbi:MAG: dATP/dGTP diphosphohydrolase domain-containing protein [Bacteroidota bacterium]
MKEKALRYNEGKPKWSLVHFQSLIPMVRVLEFGAAKYAPENWKKGLDKKQILESMMRHLTAVMDGEETDPESGISHMGHIQCNAMFYNYFNKKEKP